MSPTKTVALILALLAVFPLLRVVLRWEITMNGSPVPMWMSVAAILLFIGMSATLWRDARKS